MSDVLNLPFKISVLVFVRDTSGKLLLIRRAKEPNKGLCSPIGGKLEMTQGESPFECAIRETREEIGLEIVASDLHLFSMISERAYEGGSHWLMFLFDCKTRIAKLPPNIDEGRFDFFDFEEIKNGSVKIPETDRLLLWDIWQKYRDGGQVVLRADCSNGVNAQIEQIISQK